MSIDTKVTECHERIKAAINRHVLAEGKRVAATYVLFSGGKDSTVLAHMLRGVVDAAVHVNTGIGIEQTREFVRATCSGWNLPLIERGPPPGSTYEELVCDQGFPGPAHHFKMYQRLKERALHQVRREVVKKPREERVVFIAGRRASESKRRMNIPEMERVGSIVWVSPIFDWTSDDLSEYRTAAGDVPENEVSQLIHMSGECLCGAFAAPGERKEIGYWYPKVEEELRRLEAKVKARGHARCIWGWGADHPELRGKAKSGALCSSCAIRNADPSIWNLGKPVPLESVLGSWFKP